MDPSSQRPTFVSDKSQSTVDAGGTTDFTSHTADLGKKRDRDEMQKEVKTQEQSTKERIGHFEIITELGRGGMGIVYKAQDTRLTRLVALKVVLDGGHAGVTERQRFQIEIEAAARLQHPNIVQVYEVGEEGNRPFMSMEYCPGGSLEEQVRDQPQPSREAAQLVAKLADALQHAHREGIIHRDVKPANVLLSANGEPKLADFGLAKRLDGKDELTQTGAIIGSLGYMAPEQAAGRTREATYATDIYALGAVLYKLLTGRPPFQGPNQLEMINSIVARDPVSIRVLQRRVPQDLVTICHKCLEKNAARRYSSAQALADDLRRFLADEPIQARPLVKVERAWRWARRNPGISFTLVAGTTMLLLMASCLAWSSYRSFQLMSDVNHIQRPLQELSGRIRYLDEVLTSSALLAATADNSQWEARYNKHVDQLDAALQAAVKLAPGAESALAHVNEANNGLVALESEALDKARQGQAAEAKQILTGLRYTELKQRYAEALTTFTDYLDAHQNEMLAQARTETQVFVVIAIIVTAMIVILFIFGGWLTMHLLRRV